MAREMPKKFIRAEGWTNGTWSLINEKRYIYDGMLVVQERNSGNTPLVTYTRGNDLSGTLQGAGGIGGMLARSQGYSAGNWLTHHFYHADGNGNITYLVNSSQTLGASYKYDPFGGTISSSGTYAGANRYRFSSKEVSLSNGTYYYGYRWYHPNLQRWLNRDPLSQRLETRNGNQESMGIWIKNRYAWVPNSIPAEAILEPNLYQFVHNSPPGHLDSYGLWTFTIGWTFSGGAIFGGSMSFYLGWDGQGNFGGGVTIGHGVMIGAGTSFTGDISITNAKCLNQLGGRGAGVGFSAGEGLVGGGDFFWGGNPQMNNNYFGGSGHFGIGIGTPVEIHTGPSYTFN